MTSRTLKSLQNAGKLSLITLAILASGYAAADDSFWYLGANLGQSKATIDDPRIVDSLLGAGLTTSAISDDRRGRAYKAYGGYEFNKNFALEGGYFDLGQFGFNANTVPAGTLDGTIKLRGWNVDGVVSLPLTENFSAFGRVGVNRAQARDTFTGTGAVHVLNPGPRQWGNNLKVGLGLQYALTPSLAARAELERYRVNDAVGNKGDIDVATLGLVYRFGAKSPAPAPRAAAPMAPVASVAPVAQPAPQPAAQPIAPALMPRAAVVPPPPVRRRVSFSAESLYGFDKAVVRPEGQVALDGFAKELQGTQFDVITVEGHTDRLGTKAYNQTLSLQRAQSVKDYLVSVRGMDAAKINAVGKGETAPVTKPQDCVGHKASAKLIECLQPDRRVDVEVTATR